VNAPAPALLPLPADLDTIAKRDLVALCEERRLTHSTRATAEDLRVALREQHRIATCVHRDEQVRAVRAEWFASRDPLGGGSHNEAAAVMRGSLWGLANLFSQMQGESDELVASLEYSVPLLAGFFAGDERVDANEARLAVGNLVRAMERVRHRREEAADYASFTMGDTHRLLSTMAERKAARERSRKQS